MRKCIRCGGVAFGYERGYEKEYCESCEDERKEEGEAARSREEFRQERYSRLGGYDFSDMIRDLFGK